MPPNRLGAFFGFCSGGSFLPQAAAFDSVMAPLWRMPSSTYR